jgi:hypothetical protein
MIEFGFAKCFVHTSQVNLHAVKSYDMGPPVYFPTEGRLWIFIALRNSIASAGFQSPDLGSSGKDANHYTTE